MAVSQIVDTDTLNPCFICAPCHFTVQIVLCDIKHSVILLQTVEFRKVFLNFFDQKIGHFYHSVAFRRFRLGNNIPAVNALIGLIDSDRTTLKIKVAGGQSQ